MTQAHLYKHLLQIDELVDKIKKDPILNALVEEDLLKQLVTNTQCFAHDCMDEYNYILEKNAILTSKLDDCENDLENARYENDRLTEMLG